MEYTRYENGREQEFLVNDNELIVNTPGKEKKLYSFNEYRLSVKDGQDLSSVGFALGGIVGGIILGKMSENYYVHIVDKEGGEEKIKLHLKKEMVADLREKLQSGSIKFRKEQAEMLKQAGYFDEVRSYFFNGYTKSAHIKSLIATWMIFGGIAVYITAVMGLEGIKDSGLVWMPLSLVLIGALLTLALMNRKNRMMKSISFHTDFIEINGIEFQLSAISDLRVTSEDLKETYPDIKFQYNGKQYKFSIWAYSKPTPLNTPHGNLDYQEILTCFRVKYENNPDILVSGF